MSEKIKALKVTISGSYRTSNRDIIDFDDVSGVIPFVDDEHAEMHVRKRYALTWIKNAVDKDGEKLYPKRVERVRQVHVDDIVEVEVEPFSFLGKNIKEMSYEELQDLATLKDLRKIPLPKEISGLSLREMREKAYITYANDYKLMGIEVRPEKGWNYAKAEPLIVEDYVARIDDSEKITNEEMIQMEQDNPSLDRAPAQSTLSIDDLKAIAKRKNIPFSNNIGYDTLYERLYGTLPPKS